MKLFSSHVQHPRTRVPPGLFRRWCRENRIQYSDVGKRKIPDVLPASISLSHIPVTSRDHHTASLAEARSSDGCG